MRVFRHKPDRVRRAKMEMDMEMDRPYLEKAKKQCYEKGFGLEPSGKEVKRKGERYLEGRFGKRHRADWTRMEHC